MGKVTFVVEFEDGEEPTVNFNNTKILGGRLTAILVDDYRNAFFTDEETRTVRDALNYYEEAMFMDDDPEHAAIISKMELMTL
ncbi:hypothetical protein GWD52_20940 [Enterobacteriaceae bacterium 4M9]|nr:hypothetical protein [Enterobacteriaceae bacterium 4M9]